LIQYSNALYFLTATTHYLLVTQHIDEGFAFMEFALHSEFCVTAYYFLDQIEIVNDSRSRLIQLGKGMVIGIIVVLLGILGYFIVLVCVNSRQYYRCDELFWEIMRGTTGMVGAIYLGIGVKASIELNKLRHRPSFIDYRQGKNDLW
jgi:hypothetical protein